MSTPESTTDRREPRQIPKDLVGGLVMLGVAAVFRLKSGDERLDWIFPVVLSYVLGGLGLALVVRGLAGFGDRVPVVPVVLRRGEAGRTPGLDVAFFVVLAVAYVALLSTVGFWVMSALTLFAGTVYLETDRSPRRLALALGVAVAACVAAFVLMTRVFYVPFPTAGWLPFL